MDLNPQSHSERLERLSVDALSAGDYLSAFMYADRRCRISPLANSHHYTLRAEALRRLGEHDSSLRDIAEALDLAPEDVHANRRMLTWGHGREREVAARTLIRNRLCRPKSSPAP